MNEKSKKLRVPELAGYGIGNCIGTGVFVSMTVSIGHTGRSIVLSLLLSNLIVLFAYAYNTILSGTFKLDGGKYSQAALLQPPLLVGVSAVSNLVSGMGFAMFARSFVEYMAVIVPGAAQYDKLIAIALITVFFFTTVLGSKFMARFNMVMVAVLILSLLVFIGVGLPQVKPGVLAVSEPGYFKGGTFGFLVAAAMMCFACQGATMPIAMTKDTEDPTRSLPKAILIASGVVTVFYLLMGIVSAGILPVEELEGQTLGAVAKELFSYPVFVIFVLGGACFAIATSLYGAIAGIQNPIIATIEDGWLPAWLARRNKKGYPVILMGLMYLMAIVTVFVDIGISDMLSAVMIPTMVINTINNILMIPLMKKYPAAWKKSFFHMPWPAFYLVVVLSVLADLIVVAALIISMEGGFKYFVIGTTAVLFLYSYLRLRTGQVNMRSIEEARREAEKAAREEAAV